MSKADKSANRSAMKARAFNPRSGPIVRKAVAPKETWWMAGCENTDAGRAQFIVAQRQRCLERDWGSKTPDHPNRVQK